MAKCVRCGTETELHELAVPICPQCISEPEPMDPAFSALNVQLISAKALYREAMQAFERHEIWCRNLPTQHPDRTTSARLEERAKTAGEKYWDLLRTYGEALRRGDK
jgi:NMD protein affecting ribosome stability and mRNA decay